MPSTGLHYMNARYYSSDTGRFISQDTYSGNAFDPWTQHLYTYTSNNPINYVDPTGHYDVDPNGNKILPTGKYIAAPSRPSTGHRSTPSNVIQGFFIRGATHCQIYRSFHNLCGETP
ncbi:RHS repeat-associated core domain-containing protein [Rossellomorea arthrocnemi]|uniref:RHS repeat-associated core domain-containing protein n=1 Tax=Rossellomorea arthrocnemi TaxID=2769542 RepID=UPI00191852F3|nr:RHS repeat-associated core domain-containing protein [Rossellomorea arthrocnemi]